MASLYLVDGVSVSRSGALRAAMRGAKGEIVPDNVAAQLDSGRVVRNFVGERIVKLEETKKPRPRR